MQLVLLKLIGNTKKFELYKHDMVNQPRAEPDHSPGHPGIVSKPSVNRTKWPLYSNL